MCPDFYLLNTISKHLGEQTRHRIRLTAKTFTFIRIVIAIITAITQVCHLYTEVIVTLEFLFMTVPAIGEAWLTTKLITQIMAVPFTITTEMFLNAVT